MGTMAAVSVDTEMHVLDANDQPIENLYTVGEVMFGDVIQVHSFSVNERLFGSKHLVFRVLALT